MRMPSTFYACAGKGRLFELQSWVEQGNSLTLPNQYRQTILRVALEIGFHSLTINGSPEKGNRRRCSGKEFSGLFTSSGR